MSKIQAWLLISTIAGLSALGLLGDSVLAFPQTSVGLTRFEAFPLDNAVRLEWETETELETAGFMLKRGRNGSFEYVVDPDGSGNLFILSEGGPAFGSSYAFVDETVNNSEFYTYRLIEIEISGTEIVHGETTVTVGVVPTNTPIVLGTGGATFSDDITATITETGTPQATISPSPTPRSGTTEVLSTTPSPTPEPLTTVVRTDVATEITHDIDAQPTVALESEQLFSDETPNRNDSDDTEVAVALAQGDPEFYPGDESPTPTPAEEFNDVGEEFPEEQPETGEIGVGPATPEVIGVTPYPVDSTQIETEPIVTNVDNANSSTGLMGKMYLWVAFLAALTIFTAAILGAILLYTRQRSKE